MKLSHLLKNLFIIGLKIPNLKSANKNNEQIIKVEINKSLDDLSGNLAILFS